MNSSAMEICTGDIDQQQAPDNNHEHDQNNNNTSKTRAKKRKPEDFITTIRQLLTSNKSIPSDVKSWIRNNHSKEIYTNFLAELEQAEDHEKLTVLRAIPTRQSTSTSISRSSDSQRDTSIASNTSLSMELDHIHLHGQTPISTSASTTSSCWDSPSTPSDEQPHPIKRLKTTPDDDSFQEDDYDGGASVSDYADAVRSISLPDQHSTPNVSRSTTCTAHALNARLNLKRKVVEYKASFPVSVEIDRDVTSMIENDNLDLSVLERLVQPKPQNLIKRYPLDLNTLVPTPFEADSSQAAAIHRICADDRPSIHIEGPPGCGKTETIANTTVVNIARGRSVLLLTEKETPGEVLMKKLKEGGFDSFCLNLHGPGDPWRAVGSALQLRKDLRGSSAQHARPSQAESSHLFKWKMCARESEANHAAVDLMRNYVTPLTQVVAGKSVRDWIWELAALQDKLTAHNLELSDRLLESGKLASLLPFTNGQESVLLFNTEQKIKSVVECVRAAVKSAKLLDNFTDPNFPWRSSVSHQPDGWAGYGQQRDIAVASAEIVKLLKEICTTNFKGSLFALQMEKQVELSALQTIVHNHGTRKQQQQQQQQRTNVAINDEPLLNDLLVLMSTMKASDPATKLRALKLPDVPFAVFRNATALKTITSSTVFNSYKVDLVTIKGLSTHVTELKLQLSAMEALANFFRVRPASLTLHQVQQYQAMISDVKAMLSRIHNQRLIGALARVDQVDSSLELCERIGRLHAALQHTGVQHGILFTLDPDIVSGHLAALKENVSFFSLFNTKKRDATNFCVECCQLDLNQSNLLSEPAKVQLLENMQQFLTLKQQLDSAFGLLSDWQALRTLHADLQLIKSHSSKYAAFPLGFHFLPATCPPPLNEAAKQSFEHLLEFDLDANMTLQCHIDAKQRKYEELARLQSTLQPLLSKLPTTMSFQALEQHLKHVLELRKMTNSAMSIAPVPTLQALLVDNALTEEYYKWFQLQSSHALEIFSMPVVKHAVKHCVNHAPFTFALQQLQRMLQLATSIQTLASKLPASLRLVNDKGEFVSLYDGSVAQLLVEAQRMSDLSYLGNVNSMLTNCANVKKMVGLHSSEWFDNMLLFVNQREGKLQEETVCALFEYLLVRNLVERALGTPLSSTLITNSIELSSKMAVLQADNYLLQVRETMLALAIDANHVPPNHHQFANDELIRVFNDIGSKKFNEITKAKFYRLMHSPGFARYLLDLFPCWIISPQRLAELCPQDVQFDVVIIDEASQMHPLMALGGLCRAKQVMVVGDRKQLPPVSSSKLPTNAKQQKQAGQSGEETALPLPKNSKKRKQPEAADDHEVEQATPLSILDELHESLDEGDHFYLQWHYRSRAGRLMQYSNQQFYDNKLVIFPEVHRPLPVSFEYVYVPNGFQVGGKNDPEADQVVQCIQQLNQTTLPPDATIGVIAMTQKQRDNIFAKALKTLNGQISIANCRPHEFQFNQSKLRVFMAALDAIQGDEADYVIMSMCYETPKGLSHSRLNNHTARRFNVMITRARERNIVVCSMNPETELVDVGLSTNTETKAKDIVLDYLSYVFKQVKLQLQLQLQPHASMECDEQTAPAPQPSSFVRYLSARLQQAGFEILPAQGSGMSRVELVVGHRDLPGQVLAGVECIASSVMKDASVFDRVRTRSHMLEKRSGWKLINVCSLQWRENVNREAAFTALKTELMDLLQKRQE